MTVPTDEATTPPEETEEPTAPPADETPSDGEDDSPLHRALVAERAEVKRLKQELRDRQSKDEEARRAAMSDQERAIEEAKDAARKATVEEYESRIFNLRVQAKASDFYDTELVASLLKLDADASDEELDAALAELAKERPYLVKAGSSVPPMARGPRSQPTGGEAQSADDWLRATVQAKRRG